MNVDPPARPPHDAPPGDGDRLRALAQRLLDAQEQERRRLAHVLHGEVGQDITAAVLELQLGGDGLPAGVRDEVLSHLRGALARLRELSLGAGLPLLEDAGLAAALRALAERQAGAAGLALDLALASPPLRPSAAVEVAAYRIAQEAIANVLRHANATRLRVALGTGDGELRLEVADDGVGFDPYAVHEHASGDGLGLDGMRARATLAGGRCDIVSAPGAGTRIAIRLPLAATA